MTTNLSKVRAAVPPGFEVDFAYRLSAYKFTVVAKRDDEVNFFIFDDSSPNPEQVYWYKMLNDDFLTNVLTNE